MCEHGGGLAQLIMVMASVAAELPSFMLIDEPELNLHPSLQLDFLSEMAKYTTNGVMFSTHSIGQARASADRVYSVTKRTEGYGTVEPYDGGRSFAEFLGALSYSSYAALGFDKVLLVEGVTEVRAIQQMLRMLKKDQRIPLVPLGGSTMIAACRELELAELKRITPNCSP